MTIIEAIRSLILRSESVSSQLSSGNASRVFPSAAPLRAGYPNVTMRFDGGPSGICQDGPDGSHEVTGYLNVFAHSYDQCYALAKSDQETTAWI